MPNLKAKFLGPTVIQVPRGADMFFFFGGGLIFTHHWCTDSDGMKQVSGHRPGLGDLHDKGQAETIQAGF